MSNAKPEESSMPLPLKDSPHREELLRWAIEDPEGWAEAMRAHRRVQSEGVRGIELDDLKEELRPTPRTS